LAPLDFLSLRVFDGDLLLLQLLSFGGVDNLFHFVFVTALLEYLERLVEVVVGHAGVCFFEDFDSALLPIFLLLKAKNSHAFLILLAHLRVKLRVATHDALEAVVDLGVTRRLVSSSDVLGYGEADWAELAV